MDIIEHKLTTQKAILANIEKLYSETKEKFQIETLDLISNLPLIKKNHFTETINHINSYFSYQKDIDFIDLEKLITWHKHFLDDQKRHNEDGHNFNVFNLFSDELNVHIMEKMHSKLLKYLLNKKADHGQEEKFLSLFLKKLGMDESDSKEWKVTVEKERIDIMLRKLNPHSVVIIENKSNGAVDQKNQLYRYWYETIYSHTEETSREFYNNNMNRYQIIYLAPNKYKKVEEQSLSKPKEITEDLLPERIPLEPRILTFDIFIQDWLYECEKILKKENRVRQYIEQYRELCKTL